MKRLWPFLLLNVVVSAATVVVVLLIWNAIHAVPRPTTAVSTIAKSTEVKSTLQATLPPLKTTLFQIENVYGAGDLSSEYLHFRYLGSDPLNLQGWQIQDTKGQTVYTFPAFIIYRGGAFDVCTRSGFNSTIALYMGQTAALWSSGDSLRFLDSAGNVRLTYSIP